MDERMTKPIEAAKCADCGAQAAFQFVGGAFCRAHWDAAFLGIPPGEQGHR
jgi:hypothetical protein